MILTSSYAFAANYTAGHADMGLAEENGLALHLHVHAGAQVGGITLPGDGEYEPNEVKIIVPNSTKFTRQAGSMWDKIGNASGNDTWALPQSEQTGVPFLGIGAEEASLGIYDNNEITLTLTSMSGPSGGHFSMWQTDQFGVPTFFMSTSDAGADLITIDLDIADHTHVNWGFTAIGTYEIEFTASADLVAGGSQSSTETFTFEVVPEPATLGLVLLGTMLIHKKRN